MAVCLFKTWDENNRCGLFETCDVDDVMRTVEMCRRADRRGLNSRPTSRKMRVKFPADEQTNAG